MFLGVASFVAFLISWVFWLAGFAHGKLLTWQSAALIGLMLLAAHLSGAYGGPYNWTWRRRT